MCGNELCQRQHLRHENVAYESASHAELIALSQCFAHHFPEFRKNQVELLALVVFALIQAKDVRHAALAERCPGDAQTASVIRRIERFFDQHPITPADVARFVLHLLPDRKQREFIIDRTNWKLRGKDLNILVLAVIWRGIAVPLLFEFLDHSGNSHTSTRLLTVDDALHLLACQDIFTLYGDREFIGQDWVEGLSDRGIPVTIRLRLDTSIDDLPASEWLGGLKLGSKGIFLDEVSVYGLPMNVVLTYTRDGEALIVASNAMRAHQILSAYRRRWKIECLFRALKSKGFQLEHTHMTLHDHLERLLGVLVLAYVWCLLVGLQEECRLKKHGRRAWSVVTLGLRRLVRVISQPENKRSEQLPSLIALLFPSQPHSSKSVGY